MNPPRQSPAVPSLLRRMNVRRVLETIQTHGPSTRAQLTRYTRISPPTMSKLIDQLVQSGLLEADPEPVATSGRPAILFRLASQSALVLAAVIDVRECTVTATGLDGEQFPDRLIRFDTPSSYQQLLNRLTEACQKLMERKGPTCLGLGLTVPGLIDRDEGRVVLSPNMHFLNGRTPGHALSERLGVDAVTLQEEHALCLAARMFGKAREVANFAVVDISRGFGGEIGHMTVHPSGKTCGCGNRGCLETVATDTAVAQAISAQLGHPVTIEELVRQARAGELKPGRILDETLKYLAIGIGAAINIFNPELILVHGQLFDLGEDVMDQLVEQVGHRSLAPSMQSCRLLRTAASKETGAVAGVIQHVYTRMGPRLRVG